MGRCLRRQAGEESGGKDGGNGLRPPLRFRRVPSRAIAAGAVRRMMPICCRPDWRGRRGPREGRLAKGSGGNRIGPEGQDGAAWSAFGAGRGHRRSLSRWRRNAARSHRSGIRFLLGGLLLSSSQPGPCGSCRRRNPPWRRRIRERSVAGCGETPCLICCRGCIYFDFCAPGQRWRCKANSAFAQTC